MLSKRIHTRRWLYDLVGTIADPKVLDEIRPLLSQHLLTSACILNRLPPKGKEWVFFEWHGKLLVDLDLVDEVLRSQLMRSAVPETIE